MPSLDRTHDPKRQSWVESANGHSEFPIQNLPFGIFSPPGAAPRGGVAIGDKILDLHALFVANILSKTVQASCEACTGAVLNPFLALGATARRALRVEISDLLAQNAVNRSDLLHQASDCTMHLPAIIGDYTDFYAGIHHATHVGRLFRPDNPLLPNYKYVPIGYHGRASSIRASGTDIRRANGQIKPPESATPTFGPSKRLDFELELGIWVGPGNDLGTAIPIGEAAAHIAGHGLLNDWSARDVQAWEYQPLGPFLAKSFCTTVSPWIVTADALLPFRIAQPPRPNGDPQPLAYLLDAADQEEGALNIDLELSLLTRDMRNKAEAPYVICRTAASHLYWTPAQMLTHHASNGCNLQPGDLLGSGTISAPTPDGFGSLLEMTEGGRVPKALPSGETRRFLEDGDEVVIRGHAHAQGYVSIGFGECRARVLPA
jgi:fumarylacetoacetase